ncbi:hypothetical protein ACN077_08185 [Clostridium chromiireducens]|uniref:hypothetical protein n=1 Tax=Clostridium chromiireducens TaxID=225345 RepID=UPI003AF4CD6C
MNKKNTRNFIISFIFFILATSIILLGGYYKTSLTKETYNFTLDLNDKKDKTIIYDVANQGIPKRIVQPGKITISSGSGIINNTEKVVSLKVKAEDFPYDIDINSTDKSFDNDSKIFTKPIEAGKGVNLQLTFNIPIKDINKEVISSGTLVFSDINTGDLINELPIEIINSGSK